MAIIEMIEIFGIGFSISARGRAPLYSAHSRRGHHTIPQATDNHYPATLAVTLDGGR